MYPSSHTVCIRQDPTAKMPDLMEASIKEALWHKMRHDLSKFAPDTVGTQKLMCCACGRMLPQKCFGLEHLIPRQALKQDPEVVKVAPSSPASVRAGTLLLCKEPLKYKGKVVYGNGCNSWKGRFYDRAISELVSGKALRGTGTTQVHIIAALCLGYLAMVARFGYIVTLTQSGLLMRQQFFSPSKFHPEVPLRSQILAGGEPVTSPEAGFWTQPFSFGFARSGCCAVGIRSFAVLVPISHDPRATFAHHLRIVPSRYKLRPDFTTVFD